MHDKRSWFEELFPGWADRLAGLLGASLLAILPFLNGLSTKFFLSAGLIIILFLSWLAIKCFIFIVELINANQPPDIQVRTNLGHVTLLSTPAISPDEEANFQTDSGLCICIWNQGRAAKCEVTLRFPSTLQLQITGADGHSAVIKNVADCYVRQFQLAKGELHFLTIRKFVLSADQVDRYKETSKVLRIEVTDDQGGTKPRVQEVFINL